MAIVFKQVLRKVQPPGRALRPERNTRCEHLRLRRNHLSDHVRPRRHGQNRAKGSTSSNRCRRFKTASCCRRARFSKSRSRRERKNQVVRTDRSVTRCGMSQFCTGTGQSGCTVHLTDSTANRYFGKPQVSCPLRLVTVITARKSRRCFAVSLGVYPARGITHNRRQLWSTHLH
jgi:hypothetical protein